MSDADRLLREALVVFEGMNTTEAGVIKLRQHFQALMFEYLEARKLEAAAPAVTNPPDPTWPSELREIADRLFHLSPAESGLDQGAVDTLEAVAVYLEALEAPTDDAGGAPEAETPDEPTAEDRHSVISAALSGAELRAARRFIVPRAGEPAPSYVDPLDGPNADRDE